MFIDFRERRREKEVREKNMGPNIGPGIEPTTYVCALTDGRTCNLWV